ncbi:Pentatricopeptide repeat-containing protein At1g71420 [Linum perenne]
MTRLPTRAWLLSSTRGEVRDLISQFCGLSPPPPINYSDHAYASLFQACARHGCLHEGRNLHRHLLSTNHRPDLFLSNHIVNMYAKCGDLDHARNLFDEMPQRNIVTWTALISGYAQYGEGRDCFSMFCEMLAAEEDCRPNEFAFTSLLACCEDLVCGKQVHGLGLKMGLGSSIYVGNAMITMYGKIGDCGCGDAWKVFDEMRFRNRVSWNSMISVFQIRRLFGKAVDLFGEMVAKGVGIDRATLLSVIASLIGGENSVSHCNQMHCVCIKTGFASEIQVATSLLKAYSVAGSDPDECLKLFMEMGGNRDTVSWTTIITAFAEHKPEESFFLFRELRREDGLSPDWFTFSSVLKACAGLVTEKYGLAVHSQVIKSGFETDTVLANSLIHAYARCGVIALSKRVFDEMKYRDVVSWNSMLKAYALHGRGEEALELFSAMDVRPDSATIVALLSVCSHVGLVQKGIEIFDLMYTNHGISPQLDHYACMIDILGRAGRVSEAKELISRMPMEPDSVIWSSLLGSCRKHGNTELARFAADRLTELDPENSLGYVQMSNMYFVGGSYTEAGLIRKEMKSSKVVKEPGLSWIEIGNQVHEFASGGRRHPDREAIYTKLDSLVSALRSKGYLPDTSLSYHDIDEEHKEQQLYHHSEKLALAFALIRGENCSSGVIRIMKNIRICVDCHNFMKLASGLLEKEIVVRDSNRFHHFKNEKCSCSDYW